MDIDKKLYFKATSKEDLEKIDSYLKLPMEEREYKHIPQMQSGNKESHIKTTNKNAELEYETRIRNSVYRNTK